MLEEMQRYIDRQREIGHPVPDVVTQTQLEFITSLGKRKRLRYLKTLWSREQKKDEKIRQKKEAEDESIKEEGEVEELQPFVRNTYLRKIGKTQYNYAETYNLAMGMRLGQQIVFDFTYEAAMEWREIKHLVAQFAHLYAMNKTAADPFHIHFVNYKGGGFVEREGRTLYKDQFDKLMVDATDKGLLDVFPREQIVYLTPDSNNILRTYDHDKVYVIGALVDTKGTETGASLAQAKMLGVEHCRLPLSECLQWATSHKSLTLDAVANILMELSTHSDIRMALQKHVPQRKHSGLNHNMKHTGSGKARKPEGEARAFSFSRATRSSKWDMDGPVDNDKHSPSSQDSGRTSDGHSSRRSYVDGIVKDKSISRGDSWRRSNSREGRRPDTRDGENHQTYNEESPQQSRQRQEGGGASKASRRNAWLKS